MVGYKHTLCALLLTMITGMAIAQNNTNSPYTRYGFGDLSDQYFGNSKAMGGIAYGLRDGAQINVLNPASYTAIDSITFLFEGGVTMQNMNISGGGVKLNAKNSSLDYLAMQFRLQPWMAMSVDCCHIQVLDIRCLILRPRITDCNIVEVLQVMAVYTNCMPDWE